MVAKREIQWPRILAEGTAIVVSILLAFAIDAWWQDRKEAKDQSAQISSLLGEFKEARHHLDAQLRSLESSLAGTLDVLKLMGPDVSDSANLAFRASFDVGVTAPQYDVLLYVLASRNDIYSGGIDLRPKLQAWPSMMGDLEIDGQHLETNREQYFTDALIRLGISPLAVLQASNDKPNADSPFQLPRTKFSTDLSALLRDPGIETVFTMRAIRSQLLIQQHEYAIQFCDQVIALLESEY